MAPTAHDTAVTSEALRAAGEILRAAGEVSRRLLDGEEVTDDALECVQVAAREWLGAFELFTAGAQGPDFEALDAVRAAFTQAFGGR